MENKEILTTPLRTLGFSDQFLTASKEMDLFSINDVIETDPIELVQKKGFNYNWLGELVTYLSKHGLIYLLQPLPGKNHD